MLQCWPKGKKYGKKIQGWKDKKWKNNTFIKMCSV